MGPLVGVALVAWVGGAGGGVGTVHVDGVHVSWLEEAPVHVSWLEEAPVHCHDPDHASLLSEARVLFFFDFSSTRCLFFAHHLGISTTQSAHILKA